MRMNDWDKIKLFVNVFVAEDFLIKTIFNIEFNFYWSLFSNNSVLPSGVFIKYSPFLICKVIYFELFSFD